MKLVNVLEIYCALILLAKFGNSENEDLQLNADLIEHKINLLILLFTFSGQRTLNITEITIMGKTAINSL